MIFPKRKLIMRISGMLGLLLCCAQPVLAQPAGEIGELPQDCRALLEPSERGTFQQWQVFVQLEHCDRIKRIRRISELLPEDQRPRFYEAIVPASRLPEGFGVDLPILRVVFPDRTFFDTDKATLRPEALEIARLIAENLRREPPDVALFVAGHSDIRGSRAYNENLSIDRANAIAEEIFRSGVNLTSIWRIGFGEDMPLVAGNTAWAWGRNRRIEFLFAAKPEAIGIWLADKQLDGLCSGRSAREAGACKQELHLKDDYRVVEVVAKPRETAAAKRAAQTSVAPRPPRTISINPKARTAKSINLEL